MGVVVGSLVVKFVNLFMMKTKIKNLLLKRIQYWAKKLKIYNFYIDFDFSPSKWRGYVSKSKDKITLTIYQLIRKNELDSFIIHELGHIKFKTWKYYNTRKQRIKSEYLAEKFSNDTIKKYNRKLYEHNRKEWMKALQRPTWKRKYPEYYAAFKKIYLNDL